MQNNKINFKKVLKIIGITLLTVVAISVVVIVAGVKTYSARFDSKIVTETQMISEE